MSNIVVTGAQWGDEGKGKIVDFLTESSDLVVRAQGGNNAGHTVINGDEKYVLHLIPSGIVWDEKVCIIANGVVLDPIALLEEFDYLVEKGITVTPERLKISDRAHLVMPYHRALDSLKELALGDQKIGTTGRGIGPTYASKIERTGMRVHDLFDPIAFSEKFSRRVAEANVLLEAAGADSLDAETLGSQLLAAAERLSPFVTNTVAELHEALAAEKNVLFEGAQGTYLDIDQGTYPYVTSSNTTSGGACTGSGMPPQKIDSVVGVVKAYTTRVGEGPFPTEDDDLGDKFHKMGREFGATTGRERRCGWLDLPMIRYAVMVNGIDQMAVTILDGLDDFDEIPVCTHYLIDGEPQDLPPASTVEFSRAQPVYETLPGWKTDTTRAQSIDDLPENARAYLDYLAERLGVPVTMIGVGPARSQTLTRA